MKLYFVSDDKNTRHIIVAENATNASLFLQNNKITPIDFYELTGSIFKEEGFLMSDSRDVASKKVNTKIDKELEEHIELIVHIQVFKTISEILNEAIKSVDPSIKNAITPYISQMDSVISDLEALSKL